MTISSTHASTKDSGKPPTINSCKPPFHALARNAVWVPDQINDPTIIKVSGQTAAEPGQAQTHDRMKKSNAIRLQ